jgi:hypothetical protein
MCGYEKSYSGCIRLAFRSARIELSLPLQPMCRQRGRVYPGRRVFTRVRICNYILRTDYIILANWGVAAQILMRVNAAGTG